MNMREMFERLYRNGAMESPTLEKAGDYVKEMLGMPTRKTDEYNRYMNEAQQENERYWKDYEKNTGVRPRYPYRAGENAMYPNMDYNPLQSIGAGMKMSKLYGGMV